MMQSKQTIASLFSNSLAWAGLGWPRLAWAGLGWPGLAWACLGWPGPAWGGDGRAIAAVVSQRHFKNRNPRG